MSSRNKFERQGKLYSCPNPVHEFQFWRVAGQWQWAREKWSTLTDRGTLQNNLVRLGTIETADGIKAYSVVVWKLSIMFGILEANQTAGCGRYTGSTAQHSQLRNHHRGNQRAR